MPYGLEDVRGYDSIIPKSYAAYMQRIQPQGDLLYNRIAPIYTTVDGKPNYDALDSRLLDLLGARYVVTTHTIPNAGYELAYDQEVKVYRNKDALPRAFVVGEAVAAADQTAALDLLQTIDPAQKVVIEGIAPETLPPPASPQLREARIAHRTNREVFVDVNVSDRGWLVLADGYFDGWKAYLRPFGVEGEGVTASGESIEEQLPLYRADGAFRAVYLPKAGQWTVRFVYSPRSLLLGIYASFLAVITLLLLLGWWAWGRYYRGERSEVGTVAKNSAVQMGMSLLSRGIDFAFAMLRLRVLSPTGEGSYAFAISFYGIFEIITRYGLGTLVMRDVAVDRTRARKYLTNTVTLRIGLWLATLPVMALVCWFYWAVLGKLDVATAQAIALFAAALLFANVSDAISAVFNAFEKMEYPAGISTAIAVAKVALGALVLLPPLEWGFVGLAGVSLVMNIVQMIWLYIVLRQKILVPEPRSGGAEEQRSGGTEGRRRALSLNLGLNLNLDLKPPALHAPRIRPADAQQPAGDRLLAHQPVGAVRGAQPGGVGHLLGRREVPGRAQHDPGLLHPGHLPADEPVRGLGQRVAAQGLPAGRATALHRRAAHRRVRVVRRHAADPPPRRAGLSARRRHRAFDHDLVDPDRLHQLGDAIRADRGQPAAFPDQGVPDRGGLHDRGQPAPGAQVRLHRRGAHPDPGRAVAVHPVLLGRAPLCRADAVVQDVGRPVAGGRCERRHRVGAGTGRRAAAPGAGGRVPRLRRCARAAGDVPRRRLRADSNAPAAVVGRRPRHSFCL